MPEKQYLKTETLFWLLKIQNPWYFLGHILNLDENLLIIRWVWSFLMFVQILFAYFTSKRNSIDRFDPRLRRLKTCLISRPFLRTLNTKIVDLIIVRSKNMPVLAGCLVLFLSSKKHRCSSLARRTVSYFQFSNFLVSASSADGWLIGPFLSWCPALRTYSNFEKTAISAIIATLHFI